MAAHPQYALTPQQYLEQEPRADWLSEYHDGQVFPVERATLAHVRIVRNLSGFCIPKFAGHSECEFFTTGLRLWIEAAKSYVYPDLSIICGKLQFADRPQESVLNPKVLIEVLSPTTEGYDRGLKFDYYRTLPSVEEYIAVSQDKYQIEQRVRRNPDHWMLTFFSAPEQVLKLESVGIEVPLCEIYRGVDIAPPTP
jgi:Uma2 family endonuclease